MEISYKNLRILCGERSLSKEDLRKQSELSPATFTKLRRNQEVSISALMKIAQVMNCNIGDIMDFIQSDSE